MKKKSDELGYKRREDIKKGMQHAWRGYKKYAWGKDELKPQTRRGHDNWGGMGVTLVDSLDTLWILGMKDEFNEAKNWVQHSLTFARAGTVSVFETCIRELGGLLSAYDLSKDRVFLAKAQELGNALAKSFNTVSGTHTHIHTHARTYTCIHTHFQTYLYILIHKCTYIKWCDGSNGVIPYIIQHN